MTLQEIKSAVDAGKTVHWAHSGYTVIKDKFARYLIAWHRGERDEDFIGLTHQDNVTMNGQEADFYIKH